MWPPPQAVGEGEAILFSCALLRVLNLHEVSSDTAPVGKVADASLLLPLLPGPLTTDTKLLLVFLFTVPSGIFKLSAPSVSSLGYI